MRTLPGVGRNLDGHRVRLLLAAVHELYASALQGTGTIWHRIYEQCSLLLGSEAGGFVSIDKASQAVDIASVVGFDPDLAIRVFREFGIESDLLFTGTRSLGAGASFLGTGMFGSRAQQRSP